VNEDFSDIEGVSLDKVDENNLEVEAEIFNAVIEDYDCSHLESVAQIRFFLSYAK
jgi:hypothetical protein